jgi:hypothetical protein
MTTELKRFTEAYATMTVAVYEPLILRWYSRTTLWSIADTTAKRAVATKATSGRMLVAKAMEMRTNRLPEDLGSELANYGLTADRLERASTIREAVAGLPDTKRSALLKAFPSLETVDGQILPGGALQVARESSDVGIPIVMGNSLPGVQYDFDLKSVRGKLLNTFEAVLKRAATRAKTLPASELRRQLLAAASRELGNVSLAPGLEFMPVDGDYTEALSPIGIAHFYRQLYFNTSEGVGPIEEAFTVAPAETLEVVYETVRRQIHEELVEVGSETVSETAVESKNLDEVSDKVSSMIQRDSSAAMSANATVSASGGIGVWSASASASFAASSDLKTSSQRGTELASRRLKETTKRASERITKSFSIKTRDVLDITTTNVTRRVISNTSATPVSYALRRVYRRVVVKVQDLGSRLVWQVYLRDPGGGLAHSKFVHFLASQPIADPVAPPATKPRPTGGTDTGTTSASLQWDVDRKTYFVSLVVQTGSDRHVTAVSIDGITDLEGGGKEDYAPSARNDVQWNQKYDAGTNTFSVNIGVLPGDAASVQVNYTYVYDAGPSVLTAWEDERAAAQAAFEKAEADARQKALMEQFERDKALITERSKIRPRPANDLRREERYEVMNRMITHLFATSTQGTTPSPLEIELFHRYFDIEAIFVYTHPSWWKPRYSPVKTGLARPPYEITAESEPAPMGSSLGWLLQLDGDTRRNEFINSPWIRVCLPIRAGREREAIGWLAAHIESEIGYDPKAEPLKSLIADVEKIRKNEAALGNDGPDYVTVSSTVGAPGTALKPENVFPIVDEFEVTVPTDGFVYDELKITIP